MAETRGRRILVAAATAVGLLGGAVLLHDRLGPSTALLRGETPARRLSPEWRRLGLEPAAFVGDVPIFVGGGAGAAEEGPRRWIVQFDKQAGAAGIQQWLARSDESQVLASGNPETGGLAFLVFSGTQDELEKEMMQQKGVLFAEADGLLRAQEGDVDGTFDQALEAAQPEQQDEEVVAPTQQGPPSWGLDRIDARSGLNQLYNTSDSGGTGVHVYVADTGIRTTHVDFGGRAVPAVDFTNDVVDECNPSNWSCAMDRQGHGTHCAGTIGGITFGVAKNVSLHAVKVLGDDGSGSWSWFLQALEWVALKGQRPAVFSASLGGGGQSLAIKAAVESAVAAGVTVVVAAGNEASDACSFTPSFIPAAITVGSTTASDARSGFSNFGPCLDIFAPGSNIVSAGIETDTSSETLSGTSMACPHVSGVAALILAEDGVMTPQNVSDLLKARATPGVVSDARNSPNRLLYSGTDLAPPTTSTSRQPVVCPGFGWFVEEGDCTLNSQGCISSPNFPSNYNDNDSCRINICGSTGPVSAVAFSTERNFDILTVNGVSYSGTVGPQNVVPRGVITWVSDSNAASTGWRICRLSATTTTTRRTTTTTRATTTKATTRTTTRSTTRATTTTRRTTRRTTTRTTRRATTTAIRTTPRATTSQRPR